ncbi:MAG: TauD/TfdA dioxygenase family protein [Rhodospirillales bacterium]
MTTAVQEKVGVQITPLTELTGSRVDGIDLRAPVDESTKELLNDTLVERCCLVFPNQNLTPDEYIEAVRIFAEPVEQNYSLYHLEGYPLINKVSNEQLGPEGKRVYHSSYWHTDHTNREAPPNYTVLHAIKMPDQGGETGVLNTRAAYEALPEAVKKKIDKLQTFNVQKGSAARLASLKQVMDKDWKQFEKPMPHPLVRTHPISGKKAVYFHRGKVENMNGMTPQESQDLIDELDVLLEKPEFIYKHAWSIGDVLIWDNRQALHRAYPNFDLEQHRLLHRIITEGSKPF